MQGQAHRYSSYLQNRTKNNVINSQQ